MLNQVSEAWKEKVPTAAVTADSTLAKLRSIRIPSLNFHEASIEEAIEFLRLKGRDLDVSENDPALRVPNFVLKSGETPSTAKITLDLKDVPMEEALRYVTELAGMKYRVENNAVVIVPVTESTTEQYTRVYKVPPDFLTRGDAYSSTGAAPADPFAAPAEKPTSALAVRRGAKDILQAQGIPFPKVRPLFTIQRPASSPSRTPLRISVLLKHR